MADEHVDEGIVRALRWAGHDVEYVKELAPGIDDDAVLDLANRRSAPLLTID